MKGQCYFALCEYGRLLIAIVRFFELTLVAKSASTLFLDF